MGTSGVRHLVLPMSFAIRQSDARRMGHTSLPEMEVHDESLWAREAHLSPRLRSQKKMLKSARDHETEEPKDDKRTRSCNDFAPGRGAYPFGPNCLRFIVIWNRQRGASQCWRAVSHDLNGKRNAARVRALRERSGM
jgi:hypothetical protein